MPISVRRMATLNASIEKLAATCKCLKSAQGPSGQNPFTRPGCFSTERASFCPWNFSREGGHALLHGAQTHWKMRAPGNDRPGLMRLRVALLPKQEPRMSPRRYRELAQQATGRQKLIRQLRRSGSKTRLECFEQGVSHVLGFSLL